MNNLIQKLKKRQKMTSKALTEFFELIEELEKNIDEDITTNITKNKVNIIAEDSITGYDGYFLLANNHFSLFVEYGYIKIKNIFDEKIKDHAFTYFNNSEDRNRNIIKINFNELVLALEELIQLIVVESDKIDNDAKEFINFCENWKTQNK